MRRPLTRVRLGVLLVVAGCLPACKKEKSAGGSADTKGDPIPPGITVTPGTPEGKGASIVAPGKPALLAGWREFKHPDGAYQIHVPALPKQDRQSSPSLKLSVPLQPGDLRESNYILLPSPKQPFILDMRLTVFHASNQPVFDNMTSQRPPDTGDTKYTAHREVRWAGHKAMEVVSEKAFQTGPTTPPKRFFGVARFMVTPGRMYTFGIEREDRAPTAEEVSAFFDSFVPGP